MRLLPLGSWLQRRREAARACALLVEINNREAQVARCTFVTRETRADARACRKALVKARKELEILLASNQKGFLRPVARASCLDSIEASEALIQSECDLQDVVRATIKNAAPLIEQASRIRLDQARNLQAQLLAVRNDFERADRKSLSRSDLIKASMFVEETAHALRALKDLMEESAAVAAKAQELARLPLPNSWPFRHKQGLLQRHTDAVREAREQADAHRLLASWEQFKGLAEGLTRESGTAVAQAIREIEMWLSHPELTPELVLLFGARWRALLAEPKSVRFLEDWSDLKREIGLQVEAGFEAHWEGITDFEKLSWKQVDTAAKQIRREAIGPLYRD